MKLEWSNDKIGPTVWLAKGFGGTYVLVDGGSVRLYLMRAGESVCPISRERAAVFRVFSGAGALIAARIHAQRWEDTMITKASQVVATLSEVENP